MRMLSGAEAPDHGERREGHQVVMQYFAQDEANRLEPTRTVYETLESDSPVGMVPMIRNILGGFLFSGDDIYKKAGVLSGGERTRLAVARMLLRSGEHAAARRADEPPRPRFEGRAARRARRLRRHADLRLARPVLRRSARDQDHRRRPRRHRGLSGHLRRVPVEQARAARRASRPTATPAEAEAVQAFGPTKPSRRSHRALPPPATPGKPPSRPRPPRRTRRSRMPSTRSSATRDRAHATAGSRSSKRASPRSEQRVRDLEAQMAAADFYEDREQSEAVASSIRR